ncbi:MAG: sodium/solute symporter [Bacteroidetes bacterium]|jgi:SSS family solute:Na+ symporter|nr:sodium/solute symporter [Bacteroidota bacterium]
MTDFPISTIDLVIIVGYFAVVFVIGYVIARRTESGEDLFLAGRALAWGAIGFSLFASNISSTTLIGLAGDAYKTGIAVSNYEWMAGIVLVFMAIFLIPFFIRSRLTTIPEYLEKRFDARSRTYFSGLTIVTSILIDTAGGLYAGTLVLQTFFPELDFVATAFVLALIAGLYTAAGGLAAVVYTDILQAVILIIGSTMIAWITFGQFDFSWAQATAQLPEGHLSLIRPMDDPALPWLGTLIGVPILGLYYWGLNQYIVQRILGAKDLKHARWGAMLGGLLKLLPLFIMVLPGAFAFVLFPEIAEPDMVFPTLVSELLPVGVTGLVLAGLIAAIMSSIDSTLNSASTLVTMDFIQPRRPNLTPKQIGRIGRVVTVVLMLAAAAWAPAIRSFPGLWSYIQAMLSYLVPPVVAVFMMGLFWQRTNAPAAFWTLLGGHALSAIAFTLTQMGVLDLHFTIMAGVLTGLCFLLCLGLTLTTQAIPSDEQLYDLTWRGRAVAVPESMAWYQDYRVQAAVVVGLTVVMVIVFW